MNPIYLAVLHCLIHLKRRCPACGREQIVPARKTKEPVLCKFCGRPLPPPAKC